MKHLISLLLVTSCLDASERCKRYDDSYRDSEVLAETFIFDGHLWIHFKRNHDWNSASGFKVMHHPDCDCAVNEHTERPL